MLRCYLQADCQPLPPLGVNGIEGADHAAVCCNSSCPQPSSGLSYDNIEALIETLEGPAHK